MSSSTAQGGMPQSRQRVLDQSWSAASLLYLQELVPRFTPWLCDAVQVLVDAQPALPAHLPVLLPCCGPGHELPVVYRCLRGRHPVVGSDLAQGMVRLARTVIQQEQQGGWAPPQQPHPDTAPELTPLLDSSPTATTAALAEADTGAGTSAEAEAAAVRVAMHRVLAMAAARLGAQLLAPVLQPRPTSGAAGAAQPSSGPAPSPPRDAAASGPLPHQPQQLQDGEQMARVMQAEQLDACELDQQYAGAAAAVLSVFGLQQLGPAAPKALADWARCLAPGGLAVVVLWPGQVESPGGPWAAYGQALDEQQQQQQRGSKPPAGVPQSPDSAQGQAAATSSAPATPPPPSWEDCLTSEALQVPGCVVVSDTYITHPMVWSSVDSFWHVMTQGGPWHARRLVSGNAFMDQLKQRWLHHMDLASAQQQLRELREGSSLGQLHAQEERAAGSFAHAPRARLVVIRRELPAGSAVATPASARL